MKYLVILSAFAALSSCSGYYHIKQAKKHADKAEIKGVKVNRDTTYIVKSDTLTEIDTIDNYIRITKYVSDTVFASPEIVYIAKSRAEVRQEEKTERTAIRQEEKTERATQRQDAKKLKQARKLEKRRSFWYLWLFLGGILGVIIDRKSRNFIKSYLWK